MNPKLKKFLKTLKLNEESISMVLGGLVIVIVGILVVNYFKDRKSQTLPTALSTTAPIEVAQIGKSHTVAKGETLWSIAEDAYGSGYNWTDIYSANKLSKENVQAGQVLTIPQATAKEPTVAKKVEIVAPTATITPTILPTSTAKTTVTATPAATSVGTSTTTYTVVKGDSLWKIAVKEYGNGQKWVEIARANKLSNPNIIHSGNVLTLPR